MPRIARRKTSKNIAQESLEEYAAEVPAQSDMKLKSIESKKLFVYDQQPKNDISETESQEENDKVVMTVTDSKKDLSVNNFFGSKKTIERTDSMDISNGDANPESMIDSMGYENQANKLASIVRRQQQEKQKASRKGNVDSPGMYSTSDDYNHQNTKSKTRLEKLNVEKYEAKNIEKNMFNQKESDTIDYLRGSIRAEEVVQDPEQPSIQRRKKKSTQNLKPLKRLPSKFEVLNQVEYKHDKLKNESQVNRENLETFATSSSQVLEKKQIKGSDLKDLKTFCRTPLGKQQFLEGTVRRDRSGLNTFFPSYRILLNDLTFVIAGKKNVGSYTLSSDPDCFDEGALSHLGRLQGNFTGSIYNVLEKVEDGPEKMVATIYYGGSLTTDSIARHIELYVLAETFSYQELDGVDPVGSCMASSYNLMDLYSIGDNMIEKKIKKYISKQPIFNPNTKSYVLDFKGKVKMASVNNFIMVDTENPLRDTLVFGKVATDSYYLKVQSPLTMNIAMGLLCSGFCFKLSSQ